IAAAARAHGWKVITGGGAAVYDPGYCAGGHGWGVTPHQSKAIQGGKNGAMHPKGTRHPANSRLLGKGLPPGLYPGGKARPPKPQPVVDEHEFVTAPDSRIW